MATMWDVGPRHCGQRDTVAVVRPVSLMPSVYWNSAQNAAAYHHLRLIHWDLIHTIVGHNALALYFSPTQETLQQLDYVERHRNLGFWWLVSTIPADVLRFFSFSSFLRSLASHCFYLEIDATVVIPTTSEMLSLFWESWSRFKFSPPHILLITKHNVGLQLIATMWEVCPCHCGQRGIVAIVRLLNPICSWESCAECSRHTLMLPWTRHWGPIHTIVGHNVLALYFCLVQTKILNHSMFKPMGIFITDPCEYSRFVYPYNFLGLTHKTLYSFGDGCNICNRVLCFGKNRSRFKLSVISNCGA